MIMSKPLWDVLLVSYTDWPAAAAAIRQVMGQDTQTATPLTGTLPLKVMGPVMRSAANEMKAALEAAGATVLVRQTRITAE